MQTHYDNDDDSDINIYVSVVDNTYCIVNSINIIEKLVNQQHIVRGASLAIFIFFTIHQPHIHYQLRPVFQNYYDIFFENPFLPSIVLSYLILYYH